MVIESAGRPNYYGAGFRNLGLISGPAEGSWADPNGAGKIKGCNPATSKGKYPQGVSMNCENYNEPYGFHDTGINVLFADGSVHFLNATTPVSVMGMLATRAGGETINYSY